MKMPSFPLQALLSTFSPTYGENIMCLGKKTEKKCRSFIFRRSSRPASSCPRRTSSSPSAATQPRTRCCPPSRRSRPSTTSCTPPRCVIGSLFSHLPSDWSEKESGRGLQGTALYCRSKGIEVQPVDWPFEEGEGDETGYGRIGQRLNFGRVPRFEKLCFSGRSRSSRTRTSTWSSTCRSEDRERSRCLRTGPMGTGEKEGYGSLGFQRLR